MEIEIIEEVFTINDHPLEDKINIVFTNNINDSVKHQCELNGWSFSDYTLDDSANAGVISFPNMIACLYDVNKITDSIIVHECIHLCRYLMLPRYIHFSEDTDEIYAYYMGWLFSKTKQFHNEYLNNKI